MPKTVNFTADELEKLADALDALGTDLLKAVPQLRSAAKALRKAKATPGLAVTKTGKKGAVSASRPNSKKKPKRAAVKRTLRKVAKKAARVAKTARGVKKSGRGR